METENKYRREVSAKIQERLALTTAFSEAIGYAPHTMTDEDVCKSFEDACAKWEISLDYLKFEAK
jgi:hypothetical protein